MTYSYTTERKIKALEKEYGVEWKTSIGDLSIDAAFNALVNDQRKHLYCRISSTSKDHIDEMVESYGVKIAHFVEVLIEKEYTNFSERKKDDIVGVLKQFT